MAFNPDGSVNEDYLAVANSRYIENLRRWLKFFPRKQLHIVNGDSFVRNPFPELVKIEAFLGLKHKIRPEQIVFDEDKNFFCIKPKYASKVSPCLKKNKGRKHPKLREKDIRKLRGYFVPFDRELFLKTGIKFDWRRKV